MNVKTAFAGEFDDFCVGCDGGIVATYMGVEA